MRNRTAYVGKLAAGKRRVSGFNRILDYGFRPKDLLHIRATATSALFKSKRQAERSAYLCVTLIAERMFFGSSGLRRDCLDFATIAHFGTKTA